jgi:hypothetical protein
MLSTIWNPDNLIKIKPKKQIMKTIFLKKKKVKGWNKKINKWKKKQCQA